MGILGVRGYPWIEDILINLQDIGFTSWDISCRTLSGRSPAAQ